MTRALLAFLTTAALALTVATSALAQAQQCPHPPGIDRVVKYSELVTVLANDGFLQPMVPPQGYSDTVPDNRHCAEDAAICTAIPALVECYEDRPEKIPAKKGFCILRFAKPDSSFSIVTLNSKTDFREGFLKLDPTPENVVNFLDTQVQWFPIELTCVPQKAQNRRR